MPQLDFTWWIINFLLVWVCVLIVLTILVNTPSSNKTSQTSSVLIKKTSTTWQW